MIGDYKAQLIAEATRVLDDAAAAGAEAAVVPGAVTGKTPGQIRAAIGRAVLKADPEAAGKRRREAEKDPRVELWREDAGTAAICGYGLPPDAALAADQAITTAALTLKTAGTPGTMDQLRARAYLDALLGMDSRPTPGRRPPARRPRNGDRRRGGPRHGARGRGRPGGSPAPRRPAGGPGTAGAEPGGAEPRRGARQRGAPGAEPAGRSPRRGTRRPGGCPRRPQGPARQAPPPRPAAAINLTIPLTTLLGLTDHPGEAAGYGPIDAGLARTLAPQATGNPATTWCITITDSDGHPTAHGCATPGRRGKPRRTEQPGSHPAGTGTRPPGTGTAARPPARAAAPPGTGQRATGHDRQRATRRYGTWRLQLPGGGPALTARPEPLAVTECDHRHQTTAHDPGRDSAT